MVRLLRGGVAGLGLVAAGPALAHHPMGGETPQTLVQGLLSGLAHPVIGPDHLAFVIGVGVLSAFVPRGWILPAIFLIAGAFGATLHLGGLGLPAGETLVAVSVLLMAAAVYLRDRGPLAMFAGLCGAGGLVHGYALAESIIGAEASPLVAYFAGLVAVQFALSLGVREAVRRLSDAQPIVAGRAALAASVAILAVGVALLPVWPA